ncbi:MAG: FtsQ-type POTRA domain-containing protein [Magnetococcales bacterium]|nr:FtsQ-type POTRA domain-containing protein [Magnetococcales bacterium]
MRRLLLSLFGLLLLGAAGYGGWTQAVKPGRFPLEELRVRGATRTGLEPIKEAMAAPLGSNLLAIDLKGARERLLALPWVRRVEVDRIFPDALAVSVVEKQPVCLALVGETLVLLDEYGQTIKPLEKGDPVLAPIVRPPEGEEGPEEVVALLNLLARQAWLKEYISEARGLAGGRWVLTTRRGIRLLLPPQPEASLELLARLQAKHNLLDRPLRQVDLRIPRRVAVRPLQGSMPPEPKPPTARGKP